MDAGIIALIVIGAVAVTPFLCWFINCCCCEDCELDRCCCCCPNEGPAVLTTVTVEAPPVIVPKV